MIGYENSELQLIPFYICAIFATILIAYIKIFIKSIQKRKQRKNSILLFCQFIINFIYSLFNFSSQILIKDLFLIF